MTAVHSTDPARSRIFEAEDRWAVMRSMDGRVIGRCLGKDAKHAWFIADAWARNWARCLAADGVLAHGETSE